MNVQGWLDDYKKAWEERDPAAAAAQFTEDSKYFEQPYEAPFEGSEGVRDYWIRVTETQSDVDLRWGRPVTEGDHTAVEWWCRLKNGGTPVTLAGSMTLLFDDDGRCRELREYWHFAPEHAAPQEGWGQ